MGARGSNFAQQVRNMEKTIVQIDYTDWMRAVEEKEAQEALELDAEAIWREREGG